MRETPVTLEGPVGALEALLLEVPDAKGIALVCHPNPVQGGTMLNKVVSTLQRTARDAGYTTLRFNYRGTGASEGAHDMGLGEVDDAESATNWLRARYPDLPLVILGFSFGGFVAAALAGRLEARDETVAKLFMVAPAVMRLPEGMELSTQSSMTIIQPDADEVIAPEEVYAWSQGYAERPHELLKVAECGHFFHGKLTDLRDLVQPRL